MEVFDLWPYYRITYRNRRALSASTEKDLLVRRIRFATIVALTAFLAVDALTDSVNAEDGKALSLFQDSNDNFLHYSVAAPTASPAWMNDPFNDEAGADKKTDADGETDQELSADDRIKKLEESLTTGRKRRSLMLRKSPRSRSVVAFTWTTGTL
jgi:hypothetical protein